MSHRFVYVIDADSHQSQHHSGELARQGFRVEAAADANDLLQRQDDLPSLIILCIDPKRTGWAVCNRLRKSPLLKSTPLIITSAEATEKDFEDHKKLRTRAEEYLHKPFGAELLVEKVGGLIGLPEAAGEGVYGGSALIELPLDSEEVSLEDEGGLLEEEAEVMPFGRGTPSGSFASDEVESTRVGDIKVDGQVDLETEAAFAAIGMDGLEDSLDDATSILSAEPVRAVAVLQQEAPLAIELPLDDSFGEDDPFAPPAAAAEQALTALPELGSEEDEQPAIAPGAATPAAEEPPARPPLGERYTAPAGVERPGAARSEPFARQARPEGELVAPPVVEESGERQRLLERIAELEGKLAQRPAEPATGFSRERDFLNLRETINKKERELLDLKDALDAKERQNLDHATKLRELERTARDLDEKALAAERELVAAKEKIEALGQDKERVVERERQVKARLEDALKTIGRYEEEIEEWRQRHAADVGAAEESFNQAVAAHRDELKALRDTHEATLTAQREAEATKLRETIEAHQHEQTTLVANHEEAMAEAAAAHAAALQELRASAEQERDEARQRLEGELARLAAERAQERASTEQDHADALAALRREHELAVAEKEQLHNDEMTGLRARHTKDTKEAERRHQEELAAQKERHRVELQAADERRLAELQQQGQEHRAELEALAADHTEERQRLQDDHVLALQTLDERRQVELQEAAEAQAAELARTRQELEERLASELKAAREHHIRKMQALEESHADLKAGMQQRHAQEVEEHRAQKEALVADYDAALAERDRLLSEGHARIEELERQAQEEAERLAGLRAGMAELEERLKTALSDLGAREATLNERAQRIAELEEEAAGYQDQILKAYQRLKADESIVSRAKKALAIALTLLDESSPENSDEASS